MNFNDITLKHSNHENVLGLTNDNKLSFDEYIINICKTVNKKVNALSRINYYMKQNQKEILLSSFRISHFSYCPKKSTKTINVVHKDLYVLFEMIPSLFTLYY